MSAPGGARFVAPIPRPSRPLAGEAPRPSTDLSARLLGVGLAGLVILAPLPFGAVGPKGRLALEIGGLALFLIWAARAFGRPTPLPTRWIRVGLVGLLALAALQAIPVGSSVVALVSPKSLEIRADSSAPDAALEGERRILGADPGALETPDTLSVDQGATASAMRLGAVLVGLFLIATTVAATGGARKLALALLISAAFQGLYGLLVLTSDDPYIWLRPKEHYLDSATGTLINRNHFACLLAMSLACGTALILSNARRARTTRGRFRVLNLLDGDNSRNLVLGLLMIVGLAGLLASFSRAGIALGLLAIALTILAAGRFYGMRVRVVVALLVVVIAAVPLFQIGPEQLVARYSDSASDLMARGGRAVVWMDSIDLATSFPWVGSGYGTFALTYPLFRSPGVRLFYAHAHNDLIQAAVEGGIVGMLLLSMVLVPVFGTAFRSLLRLNGTLAVGFSAAFIAVMLHSLVDFNFHIPSNAATAVVVAGALQGLEWRSRTSR